MVLKQQSDYVEYYYRALSAWEHYVPFYVDAADDILRILPNITADDKIARAIGHRGQRFAHANLHVDARQCYWRMLLDGWSHRLAYTPTLDHRPSARREDGHYTCGECRRPPNPALIGPWPEGHACSVRERAATVGAPISAPTVAGCRRKAAAKQKASMRTVRTG